MSRYSMLIARELGWSPERARELLDLAAEIALTHHERYDGAGYPSGLSGTAIPAAGRIVAVADVFDALTSVRVYKDAIDVSEAVQIIRGGRGTQFDPEVVDAFLRRLDAVRALHDQCGETGAPDVPWLTVGAQPVLTA